ncbi:MAG: DUF697 domain-containing protein [Sphingopyxis sp.]|nr:DUF697 domain-containing protein [Sphingopyxis sp.]
MTASEDTNLVKADTGSSVTKEAAALELVRRHAGWAAAGGLVPMPGLDVAAILASQLKMLSDIAALYDITFKTELVRPLVGSLVSSLGPVAVAQASGSLLKTIPFVGTIAAMFWQPALASATTWALGKVFIQHFESGGTFLDFNPESVRAYFRKQFEVERSGSAKSAKAA